MNLNTETESAIAKDSETVYELKISVQLIVHKRKTV